MKKIIITQYREEPSGSTIGAWEYHYGIRYTADYHRYSVITTQESLWNMMRIFKEAGYEIVFIEKWKEDDTLSIH